MAEDEQATYQYVLALDIAWPDPAVVRIEHAETESLNDYFSILVDGLDFDGVSYKTQRKAASALTFDINHNAVLIWAYLKCCVLTLR